MSQPSENNIIIRRPAFTWDTIIKVVSLMIALVYATSKIINSIEIDHALLLDMRSTQIAQDKENKIWHDTMETEIGSLKIRMSVIENELQEQNNQ